MDFNKFWGKFKQDADSEKLIKAVREVQQRSKDASEAAKEAERAYLENVEKKKEKISSRIDELNKRLSTIESEYGALKYPLTSALANESSTEEAKIRSTMQALEEEKVRVANEIELLQSAYIRGDDVLYRTVEEKHNQYLKLKKVAQGVMETVHKFDFAKRYEAVTSCCYYWHDYHIGTSLGVGADMELINKNYNAEDNAKRTLEETKRKAEEVERRQVQGRVKITHHINSDSDIRANPGFNPNNFRNVSESAGSNESLQLATEIDYTSYRGDGRRTGDSGNGGDVRRAGRERPTRNDTSSAALSAEEKGILHRTAARAQTLFRR